MNHLPHIPPLALIGDFGLQELLLVALASVMIFGRRLPQVAARAFAQFQRFRRTVSEMWRETGIEDEVRRIQRDLDKHVPRNFDPANLARRETREIEKALKGDERAQPRSPSPSRDPGADAAQAAPRAEDAEAWVPLPPDEAARREDARPG